MIAPLVGRTSELELLVHLATQAVHGQGALVHLVGEAGAGKSSLLAAAAAELRAQHVTVRAAAADEIDRHRRGAVIRDLLSGLTASDGGVDEMVSAVEQLADGGPVALLADDLHWADDVSLDGLRAIGRRSKDLGVVLVTAARPRPRLHSLVRLEELAAHDGTRLGLSPLATGELAELVVARCGAPPGPRLQALLDATHGNPFLATELLDSLHRDITCGPADTVDVAPGVSMPGDLTERLAARVIASVGGDELLVRALAVVPGGATSDELAAITGRPTCAVVDAVLRAVGEAVLVDTGAAVTFRHELLRQAVEHATPPSIWRTLTRLAADVLIARSADPARIAMCLLAGADERDPGDVERLIDLGRKLHNTHPSPAADLLGVAIRALPERDERLGMLTVELGSALVDAGRPGEVEAILDARVTADGPVLIALDRLRGVAASLTGRLDVVADRYDKADIAWLVEHYDADDPDVVDAAAELAMLRISCGRPAEAATIADWVDASPSRASAFRTATIHTVRSQICTAEGRFETAAHHARKAATWAARDETMRASGVTPALALAVALDLLGDGPSSLEVSRQRARVPFPGWGPPLMQFFASLTLYRRGEWDDAIAEVDAGLVAAEEVELAMGVFWPFSVASLVATARGRSAEAQQWLDRSRSSGAGRQLGAEWLAFAALMREDADGDATTMLPLVQALVGRAVEVGAPAVLLNGGAEMIRVCLRAGRTDLAESIADQLGLVTRRTHSPVAAGVSVWARGVIVGDAAAIADAAAILADTGRIPEAARAHHAAAVIAARQCRIDDARDWARRAVSAYDQLDAGRWRQRLLAELSAAGVTMRPRRRVARPATGWESLTASEAAIVELVGKGLTNSAIAERQYVSRRTVESHLGRAYTKLGLGSRSELIAAVARR